jgi:BirA family transcriptional regulator, biotin operon repressor / biotin---[acetyl-CoA-carboxylase] ligase
LSGVATLGIAHADEALKRRLEARTALMQLPAGLVATGDELLLFDTIDSTMEEARRRFTPELRHRIWIVAGEQTAGRGRHGRIWVSPPGNLHLTLLAPVRVPLRIQPKLGFAAGVALAVAAEKLLPSGALLRLKWPNDLLLDGGKVSGLLLEGHGQGRAVAIGMGVNIVAHPQDTPYPAAHLGLRRPEITRDTFFSSLSSALAEELDSFSDGTGFPLTRQRWLARAAHLGQRIQVRQDADMLEGVFRDLDDEGQLLLETARGLLRIAAGDVFPLDK